jgi:hypothetical protein
MCEAQPGAHPTDIKDTRYPNFVNTALSANGQAPSIVSFFYLPDGSAWAL